MGETDKGGNWVLFWWTMLSKSLIQFSVDGWSCVPSLLWSGFDPWVRKIHWRRKWQPTPVLLPGRSHGLRSLVDYSPWDHKESDTTERLHFHYREVNGDFLQEGFCHPQICCTQSPCPCGRPLLTRPSTGDTQIHFCLSLCSVSESWCTQDLFEPSECFCQEWGLILNMNLPLLPSCWGFSFALGCGASPHNRSSA